MTIWVEYFQYAHFKMQISPHNKGSNILECGCNEIGSTSLSCDSNGICNCMTNFIGDKCSACKPYIIGAKCTECQPGYYGFPYCQGKFCWVFNNPRLNHFKILDCGCNIQGSSSSTCNSYGTCNCKTNVIGAKCTACKTGFYGFPNCNGKHF